MVMWSKIVALLLLSTASALVPTTVSVNNHAKRSLSLQKKQSAITIFSSNKPDSDGLEEKFGGYTVKQRLREEVESPFRQVRLFGFGGAAASAALALYFSSLAALKAQMGGFSDAQPLDQALQSCAINLGAVVICSVLAYRDYKAGEKNLARIAKGGALASLSVASASSPNDRSTLKEYRRNARVVLAAGGKDYISELSRALNADQREDVNQFPAMLEAVDVIVVPVLLEANGRVADTQTCWLNTMANEEGDRNFNIERANNIIHFPVGSAAWTEYFESELETAKKQGFDVISKGITITVKKNGKILKRATGQPQWQNFIDTMEVMDGSAFGMPGDSEKYGGP